MFWRLLLGLLLLRGKLLFLDPAQLRQRIGQRLDAVGQHHAHDRGHVTALGAQRGAGPGRPLNRRLVQHVAVIAVHHVQPRTVDRGQQVMKGVGSEAGVLGPSDLLGPQRLPGLGVEGVDHRPRRLHVEGSPVQDDVADAAAAAVHLDLGHPRPGQAEAGGPGVGKNFAVVGGQEPAGGDQQPPQRENKNQRSHRDFPLRERRGGAGRPYRPTLRVGARWCPPAR